MILLPHFFASRSSAAFSIADFVTDQTPQRVVSAYGIGPAEVGGGGSDLDIGSNMCSNRGSSE
jgi:hypothetical protein